MSIPPLVVYGRVGNMYNLIANQYGKVDIDWDADSDLMFIYSFIDNDGKTDDCEYAFVLRVTRFTFMVGTLATILPLPTKVIGWIIMRLPKGSTTMITKMLL